MIVNSPWGVRKRTTAPGIRSSLAVVSTMVCSAAWSIGLSAGGPGREHAAIRRVRPTKKLAAARRENSNANLPMHHCGVARWWRSHTNSIPCFGPEPTMRPISASVTGGMACIV